MKNNNESSRRKFLRSFAATAAAVSMGPDMFAGETKYGYFERLKRSRVSANDNINFALVGAGGMGTQDTITALKVPGTRLVAICDLYDGRLEDAKKKWGADLFATRSYKEILGRKDIDAIIVGTPDHWHQQIQ